MARAKRTTATTSKPGVMSRLRARPQPRPAAAKVTQTESTNPITGTHTTTTKRKTHPRGVGAAGHGGRGPMASEKPVVARSHKQRRKPGIGDKLSGAMMKLKGSVTRKPGVKAAGTKRMHGTDGKRSRRRY